MPPVIWICGAVTCAGKFAAAAANNGTESNGRMMGANRLRCIGRSHERFTVQVYHRSPIRAEEVSKRKSSISDSR
jgi:hypothetical protein